MPLQSYYRPTRLAGSPLFQTGGLVLLLAGVTCCLGCRGWPGPSHRPSVEDLFNSAVIQAAGHPENSFASELNLPSAEIPLREFNSLTQADQLSSADLEELPEPQGGKVPKVQVSDEPDTSGQVRISEVFQETDIREALQVMAATAKQSLIVDDKVRGIVNATIEDLPFERALARVLLPLGLVYAKRGNDYLVGTSDPDSALFPLLAEHVTYLPLHRTPTQLATIFPERMKRYVRFTENTNQMLVDAPPQYAKQIIARLKEADSPVPQVMLEAIVCVINPDNAQRFGLDWNQALPTGGTDSFSVGMSGLAFTGKGSTGGARNAFADFAVTSAFVKLLATHGYLAIRASPRVMAKDNEKATISISRESYFSIQQGNSANRATDTQSTALYFQQNIQKVDAGIILNITPQVRGDNVTVNIERAEVSEDIRNSSSDQSANPYPIINRRTVSTTVHVQDGKTIVIGGLVQRQSVERINKIPGLSRLPGIGRAFQTLERQEQDVEVVIFISPKIIANAAVELPSQ